MEKLQATFDKLLRETTTSFHRYMYNEIDWDARMVGLLGPRGVGKTTMVLQHIKSASPAKKPCTLSPKTYISLLIPS